MMVFYTIVHSKMQGNFFKINDVYLTRCSRNQTGYVITNLYYEKKLDPDENCEEIESPSLIFRSFSDVDEEFFCAGNACKGHRNLEPKLLKRWRRG